jgi:hypothetical protein
MRNKSQTPQLNILDVMGSLFILSLNALGTLAWIHLYISGRYTEWWAIGLVIICGITAIMAGVKLWKQVRGLFL